jgi:prepilin-type N-terminal cleavage/methylation domain-containing protein
MKFTQNKAFTLVELLVVITILAIISVVAYQNFGGAVDKAVSGRKIGDVATIESSLMQYKADKNFYPKVGEYSATNQWGYTGSTDATISNPIRVTYDGDSITSVLASSGGGKIYGSGAIGQIGAK